MIVEPVAGNMGVVPPDEGYLPALRAACDAAGALLILDEVITGFRVARGGAQERYGRAGRPHLLRQGHRRRPAGGGLRRPRRRHGASSRPRGPATRPARCRGTRWRPPPASRCWRSSPARASTRAWRRAARRWRTRSAQRRPRDVNRVGSMLTPFFADGPVIDYASATMSDTDAYGAFARALARRRRLPAAVPVRGLVRRARARRGRDARRPARPGAGRRGGRVRAALAREPALAAELVEPAAPPLLAPLVAPPLTEYQAAGLDLILEGFLLHHGRPRHLAPQRARPRGAGRRLLLRPRPGADRRRRRPVRDRGARRPDRARGGAAWPAARREALPPLWRATAAAIAARRSPDEGAVGARFLEAKRAPARRAATRRGWPRSPRPCRPRRALAEAFRAVRDLRDWIARLERDGELARVAARVDPHLEITEIADRVSKAGGPALLFTTCAAATCRC